jgi:hypothetical protein
MRFISFQKPITVVARSEAWTASALWNAGMVVSNATQGMDVCVCVYSVFVLSCVQAAALRRVDHLSKESYRLCKKRLRRGQGPTKSCITIDEQEQSKLQTIVLLNA